ncbi:MAG TPA: hypothetical protein VJH20_02370 [Candidatus Nanoarchaeia archaeon]|nr:hypothetical protein [Candidatus Nanoarchaeia archaeon]
MKRVYILIILGLVLFFGGCKNTTTGNVIKDINYNENLSDENNDDLQQVLVNYSNQTYFVNKTIDYSKEARARINDAKEEISKTILKLKDNVDRKLISNKRKQKIEKLINSAELLVAKSEESYKNGFYENSIDLAVDSKIKIVEAQSVID